MKCNSSFALSDAIAIILMDKDFREIGEMTELADRRKSCNFAFTETLFRIFATAGSSKIGPGFRKSGGNRANRGRKGVSAGNGYATGISCRRFAPGFRACGRQPAESAIPNWARTRKRP